MRAELAFFLLLPCFKILIFYLVKSQQQLDSFHWFERNNKIPKWPAKIETLCSSCLNLCYIPTLLTNPEPTRTAGSNGVFIANPGNCVIYDSLL